MSYKIKIEQMRIAGKKVDCIDYLEVRYPYTNQVIGTVPRGNASHARTAFKIAADYKPSLSRYERQEILFKIANIINSRKDELSDLITLESGLCKKDSLYEVGRAYDVYSLAAQQAIIDDGEIFSCDITPQGKNRKIFTQREPLTAISAITPFNHPLNMISHKIAPAIATNNCIICKPAEKTPLTALLLADIIYDAGLPKEMLSIITGLPGDLGDEFIRNENIELITFTGGVPFGKYIAENAGYRRIILELGGNAPLIVMDDADLDKAAEMAVAGGTKNSGQRCTAVKRVLVMENIADEFAKLVAYKASKIKYGDPMDLNMDLGTVIDEEAAILFENRVNDAVDNHGAKLLYGNIRDGALYSPTVLDNVAWDCQLVMEETFGPVIPIIRCKNIDEIIKIANGTKFGLSTGVCTNNLNHINRFIAELRTGTVNIWEVPGYRIEMSPFGGIKDSGLGYKEGVIEAMKSYTNVKSFSLPWQMS